MNDIRGPELDIYKYYPKDRVKQTNWLRQCALEVYTYFFNNDILTSSLHL